MPSKRKTRPPEKPSVVDLGVLKVIGIDSDIENQSNDSTRPPKKPSVVDSGNWYLRKIEDGRQGIYFMGRVNYQVCGLNAINNLFVGQSMNFI